MAFSQETKIFTDKGWKLISDLSGRDRVLVRNFLGEAEFTQPFALNKNEYSGEMVTFGNKEWEISLTPDHKIVSNPDPKKLGTRPSNMTASDVVANDGLVLFRRFRYNQEAKRYEAIEMKNSGVEWKVSISLEDWYTILAYTMLYAYIDKRKTPHIMYVADEEKLLTLTNIFDMIGVRWSWNAKQRGAPQISLRNDSNLVSKLIHQLGSRERRDMRLPDRLIYGTSAGILRHFVGTILSLQGKPIRERPGQYSFVTANKNLIENLEIMCLLGGFGFSIAGEDRGYRVRIIIKPTTSWNVRFVEKKQYLGYTYEIDLFDGLVYVTEKKSPVWMAAK